MSGLTSSLLKGPVTGVIIMATQPHVVISCSKDSFVKFWDLRTQHCFKTLTGHLGEIWSMVSLRSDQLLVTGGGDSELRVWSLDWREKTEKREEAVAKRRAGAEDMEEEEDGSNLTVERVGSILRKGEGKVGGLQVDKTGRLLVCHGSDNLLELFIVCSEEEVERRLAKRLKKERKRAGEEEGEVTGEATLQEMVRRVKELKVGGKLRGTAVQVTKTEAKVLVLLANNLLETVRLDLSVTGALAEVVVSLAGPGHRSDVRSLAWSSDNTSLVTGSSESVKLWNRSSLVPVRTISSGYCLGLAFCPGHRHVIAALRLSPSTLE